VAVARLARPGDLPGRDLQRREQGRGAMAFVVVRATLRQARLHGQHRSGPVQRLDLRLLIDAQHDRVLRRRQVEPDDIDDLADQLRVGGELERLNPPWRDAVVTPRLRHGPVTDPQVPAQESARPVGQPVLLRRRLERRGDDVAVIDRPRATRARIIVQPRDPLRGVPIAPVDHRRARHPDLHRDRRVRLTVCGQQHDPGPLRPTGPHRGRPRQPRQFLPVTLTQPQRDRRTICHAPSSQPANRKSTNYTRH